MVGSLSLLGVFAGSPIYDVTYRDGSVVRYAVTMYATVLEDDAEGEADGQEILDVAWFSRGELERIELAPDMVEIVPAAFSWFGSERGEGVERGTP